MQCRHSVIHKMNC